MRAKISEKFKKKPLRIGKKKKQNMMLGKLDNYMEINEFEPLSDITQKNKLNMD